MKIEETVSSMFNYTKWELIMNSSDFWGVTFDCTNPYSREHKMRFHDLESCLREVRTKACYFGYLKLYARIDFRLVRYDATTFEVLGFWDGYASLGGIFLDFSFNHA